VASICRFQKFSQFSLSFARNWAFDFIPLTQPLCFGGRNVKETPALRKRGKILTSRKELKNKERKKWGSRGLILSPGFCFLDFLGAKLE
jgi:hypothetical protein